MLLVKNLIQTFIFVKKKTIQKSIVGIVKLVDVGQENNFQRTQKWLRHNKELCRDFPTLLVIVQCGINEKVLVNTEPFKNINEEALVDTELLNTLCENYGLMDWKHISTNENFNDNRGVNEIMNILLPNIISNALLDDILSFQNRNHIISPELKLLQQGCRLQKKDNLNAARQIFLQVFAENEDVASSPWYKIAVHLLFKSFQSYSDINLSNINNTEHLLKLLQLIPYQHVYPRILNCSFNNIAHTLIQQSVFLKHSSTLTSLDLSHNRISFIPEEFLSFTSLTSLNLQHNQLETFPLNILIPSLITLELQFNAITILPLAFCSLNKLIKFNIDEVTNILLKLWHKVLQVLNNILKIYNKVNKKVIE